MAHRMGQHFMPTGRQLKAAGRQDLVKQIVAAGGFTEVAHRLGLRARRRPQGAPQSIPHSFRTPVLDLPKDHSERVAHCTHVSTGKHLR